MCDGILEEKGTWFNLWKIKNPHLRNYRLKVAYKDVYSQERRFKFRLNDSPSAESAKIGLRVYSINFLNVGMHKECGKFILTCLLTIYPSKTWYV